MQNRSLSTNLKAGLPRIQKLLGFAEQPKQIYRVEFFLKFSSFKRKTNIYSVQQYFYIAEHMYYFVIPTYAAPNQFNWLLPVCQTFVQNEIVKQEIEVEDVKSNFPSIYYSKTVAKEIQPIVVSQQKPKNGKQSEKPKNQFIDEDYQPEVYVSNKSKKMPQLENRNVIPNAVRLILSFIQKKGKSEIIVQKLFKQYGLKDNWSLKRFYLYQSIVKAKLNNYVNEETIKKLVRLHPQSFDVICEEEQKFYNKITRVLINFFLRDEFLCSVLTSKRMDKTKTFLHLSVLRRIRNRLTILLSQQTNSF